MSLGTPNKPSGVKGEPRSGEKKGKSAASGTVEQLRQQAASGRKRLWSEFVQKELLPCAKRGCSRVSIDAKKFSNLDIGAQELSRLAVKEGMEARPSGGEVSFDLHSNAQLRKLAHAVQDNRWRSFTKDVLMPLAKRGHLRAQLKVETITWFYASLGLDLDGICETGRRNGITVDRLWNLVRSDTELKFDWAESAELANVAEKVQNTFWHRFFKELLSPSSCDGSISTKVKSDDLSKWFEDLSREEACALATRKGLDTKCHVESRPGAKSSFSIEFIWGDA